MRVRVNISDFKRTKTLAKKLRRAGPLAQHSFVRKVYRRAEKYTPFKTGALKNQVIIRPDSLDYRMPYAVYQWHGRGMHNYSNNASGLRGSHWLDRMYIAEQKEIKREVKQELLAWMGKR